MANLYFNETLRDTDFAVGSSVAVSGDEARHAVRVSRLREGERISVGNGAGVLAHGAVTSVDRDRFAIHIDEISRVSLNEPRLVLVQALAKGDRDERAVEQATEFGVDEIVPWQASRSVSRWDGAGGGEKAAKGVAKWQRIAREASKQSLRAWIPGVSQPVGLKGLCELASRPDTEVIALHPRGGKRLTAWASGDAARSTANIMLVVGPEGGLSDSELDALESAGAHILLLGDTVLRTSSAGSAALAVLNTALGRW